jgi:hypothetical protein
MSGSPSEACPGFPLQQADILHHREMGRCANSQRFDRASLHSRPPGPRQFSSFAYGVGWKQNTGVADLVLKPLRQWRTETAAACPSTSGTLALSRGNLRLSNKKHEALQPRVIKNVCIYERGESRNRSSPSRSASSLRSTSACFCSRLHALSYSIRSANLTLRWLPTLRY